MNSRRVVYIIFKSIYYAVRYFFIWPLELSLLAYYWMMQDEELQERQFSIRDYSKNLGIGFTLIWWGILIYQLTALLVAVLVKGV